jgi:hypothetical protein
MDLEHIVTLLAGFALVFIFADLYLAACRRKTGRDLTDFQRFLFGTGAVYYCIVLWELLKFFLDYYIPGSAKQGFQKTAEDFALFYKLFGEGKAGEAQLPLLNTDLNFVCGVVGGALGGAAFLLLRHFRNKKRNTPQRGLFYGYTFPKKTAGQYFRDELAALRAEVPLWEYLTWWLVRGLLVYGIVTIWPREGFNYNVLQMFTNLAVSFVIPLIRCLFFAKLYLGRISFHIQSIINIFVVTGTVLGHIVGLSWKIPSYDKLLHFVSGGIAVFIGYILICGARNRQAVTRGAYVAASSGFSCVVIILWEIFEFIADYSLPDCNNQDYLFDPPENLFFFRIFGRGAQNAGQNAVLDTDLDIILAVLGVILCAAILWAALYVKDKKKIKVPEAEAVKLKIEN